ncbi:hypothetical protein HMPREF3032_00418 [Veillonella sp. DNF00869]|jgi:hypothetical protein|nr:hypothetical protein HMPREF3032_00418 [Veillonella sp. DNF00869]
MVMSFNFKRIWNGVKTVNKKAELFQQFIEQNELTNLFTLREIENDQYNTAIFDASIEYNDIVFPLFVVLDDTPFGFVRLEIAGGRFTPEQRKATVEVLNQLNSEFKCFKHYLMEEDGYEAILLDVSLMSGDNFEPELVAYTIFEVLYPHTQKDLTRIIAAVESVKVENTAVEETATKKESKPRKTTKSKKD